VAGIERKLKGINFIGTLKALERQLGRRVRERVEERLEGDVGDCVRHGALVASGWYPASWYDALLQTVARETGGGERTMRSLSREAVREDFATLFRVVRLFLSPERALQQSMRVSRRYVDGGEVAVLDVGPGRIHYSFCGFHGYTRLMWNDYVGAIEGVLESLGAEEISARTLRGGNDGDHQLEVLLRWRA